MVDKKKEEKLPLPDFAISIYESEENVDIQVHLGNDDEVDKMATLATLYGVAILMLDRQGIIDSTVQQMLENGPISQSDAINTIALLLSDSSNDLPA